MGQVLFGIVMKASFWLMILASSLYILVALTLGLLISSVTKSQMVANQMAVLITYLPSLLLSNFVFPVINMPTVPPGRHLCRPGDLLHRHPRRASTCENLGFAHLWPDLCVLTGMFAILAALNVIILKREGL